MNSATRPRWAAVGAAIAITLGAGSVANVRAFDVAAGSITVNLVCEATQGADVGILRPQMSVLFVPS